MKTCPLCKKGTLRPWSGTIELSGLEVTAKGVRCSACEEIIFTGDEVDRHQRFVVDEFVRRGIRRGHEFVWVRKMLSLRANEVAALLDVTPETVSRWEHDVIPIPRLAAFALGELYERPRVTRAKLEALAADRPRRRAG